ncbi:peptidase M50B-like-domain-containing protein, partial [Russula earlei]
MPLIYPYDYDAHQLSARSFASTITPNATQRTTLLVAGCYILIIGILWHVPYLNFISESQTLYPFPQAPFPSPIAYHRIGIVYPFKLLTVGFHEMSHAFAGVLTCARIHSIELDPDEGGATSMSGGIAWITLPAGYLGSSLIGAALITCGFDTNASKVASLILAIFFVFTLWWARRNLLTWVLLVGMSGLIVLFWFLKGGEVLRYLVLFIGVMSCLYALWDVIGADPFSRNGI